MLMSQFKISWVVGLSLSEKLKALLVYTVCILSTEIRIFLIL